jgi:hypothetical protein
MLQQSSGSKRNSGLRLSLNAWARTTDLLKCPNPIWGLAAVRIHMDAWAANSDVFGITVRLLALEIIII